MPWQQRKPAASRAVLAWVQPAGNVGFFRLEETSWGWEQRVTDAWQVIKVTALPVRVVQAGSWLLQGVSVFSPGPRQARLFHTGPCIATRRYLGQPGAGSPESQPSSTAVFAPVMPSFCGLPAGSCLGIFGVRCCSKPFANIQHPHAASFSKEDEQRTALTAMAFQEKKKVPALVPLPVEPWKELTSPTNYLIPSTAESVQNRLLEPQAEPRL
ncbi:hypothetical protein QYF61_010755 [Mycteria americana]|uniref:Uncharacterized protein n=1 Tax=Mycteria americana TaxID=33587 RepID=A0AAN7S0R0_MYCAM|nr:hypothetical protein QYF61_010755 [Mycteria americana]